MADRDSTRRLLDIHLDWTNRTPTPFISVYATYQAAKNEARRIITRGMKEVIIAIDVGIVCGKEVFCNVRRLAEKLDYGIPEYALNNSKHEYIFVHCIPNPAIVGIEEFDELWCAEHVPSGGTVPGVGRGGQVGPRGTQSEVGWH